MAEKCSRVLEPIVNCDSLRSDPTSDFTASGEQHRFTLRRPLGRPPKKTLGFCGFKLCSQISFVHDNKCHKEYSEGTI